MTKIRRKSRWLGFWVFCLAFALVFFGGTVFALDKLEGYLVELEAQNTAKEAARPELARDAYLEKLDADYVASQVADLYTQVDSHIQSPQECRAVVLAELSQGIGYKLSFTSADKQTYTLYSKRLVEGKYRQVGEFTIAPQGTDSHGYTPWAVVEEYYNMDYLLTPGISYTIPEDYTLWVNGKQLGLGSVQETRIPYEALAHFPQELPLPTRTSYATGCTLGAVAVEIRDPQGAAVALDTENWDRVLNNCAQADAQRITSLTDSFLADYVRFTSPGWTICAITARSFPIWCPMGIWWTGCTRRWTVCSGRTTGKTIWSALPITG